MKDEEELVLGMLTQHRDLAARVPLASFRPGTTKIFMAADVPYILRNLKHKLLFPFALKLQNWWQGLGADLNQRKAKACARSVTASLNKAALHAVAHLDAVRFAEEQAVGARNKLNDLFWKQAMASPGSGARSGGAGGGVGGSGGGGSEGEAREFLAALHTAVECAASLFKAVEGAIEAKEEGDRVRAEVLGQLDAQQDRVNQVLMGKQRVRSQSDWGSFWQGGSLGWVVKRTFKEGAVRAAQTLAFSRPRARPPLWMKGAGDGADAVQ